MLLTTSLAAFLSYLLMLAAYFRPRQRYFHIPVMIATMVFDVALPIFLYLHRNWWHRLIEQQDIFSSLVWMHFILLITMYALDGAQINSARKVLKGDFTARDDHHSQGRALLIVRALVILSGAILANPD